MSFSDPDRNPAKRNPAGRQERGSEDYSKRPTPRKSAAPRDEVPRGERAAASGERASKPRESAPRSAALESLRSRTYEDSASADTSYRNAYRERQSNPAGSRMGSYGRSHSYGGGGYGGGPGGPATDRQTPAPGSRSNGFSISNASIVALVALVMFFAGFAMRDVYTAEGGFDDERPIQADQVPEKLRNFCIQYNGYPSFSLLTVDTISSLTASSVPILKLDTCTIPTRETANALAALGVEKRSESIGLQLGGSNLTLVVAPLADRLASQLYSSYPGLASDLRGSTRDENVAALQERIGEFLVDDINKVTLQNVVKTNLPGVFAVAPGHSFPIQPSL
ncbi:MAG: hypothetical protein AAGB13_09775, partial [Cyanobacteria bacterium P01_F01_bin.33]